MKTCIKCNYRNNPTCERNCLMCGEKLKVKKLNPINCNYYTISQSYRGMALLKNGILYMAFPVGDCNNLNDLPLTSLGKNIFDSYVNKKIKKSLEDIAGLCDG